MKMNSFDGLNFLDKDEMLQINGGSGWRTLGAACKSVYNFFIGMAEASAGSYHMGMM
jgi:hypothetical protein